MRLHLCPSSLLRTAIVFLLPAMACGQASAETTSSRSGSSGRVQTGRARPEPARPGLVWPGLVWKVQGNWQTNGRGLSLAKGDTAIAGSLVQPANLNTPHSITLLLPDGQRLLFECFTTRDCARGFRVPELVDQPSPFAAEMLDRMRRVLRRGTTGQPSVATMAAGAKPLRTSPAKADEAVAVRDANGVITLGASLATLEDGAYTYQLRRVDGAVPIEYGLPLVKSGATCKFPLPADGLYEIAIADQQQVARINFFVAAIEPSQAAAFSTYGQAVKTLAQWNDHFSGWPINELLRAYLQSLFEDMAKIAGKPAE